MQSRLIVLHRQVIVGLGLQFDLEEARIAALGVDGHQTPVGQLRSAQLP